MIDALPSSLVLAESLGKVTPVSHQSRDGRHQVLCANIFDTGLSNDVADIIVLDPPAVPDSWNYWRVREWFATMYEVLDQFAKPNAALILMPRDRKGFPYSKSSMLADLAYLSGWELFREFIWHKQDADFHRANYAYSPIFAFRRGNMPVQDCDIRYKDLIHIVDRNQFRDDDGVHPIGAHVVFPFLKLFANDNDLTVLDPFAGGGGAASAAKALGLRSISIELHPDRAEALRQLLLE